MSGLQNGARWRFALVLVALAGPVWAVEQSLTGTKLLVVNPTGDVLRRTVVIGSKDGPGSPITLGGNPATDGASLRIVTEGATAVEDRHAAFAGRADDAAVSHYVGLVRSHPARVTDADIQRLRAVGLDDDAIFELTVAAALGAGMDRLRAGLSLLGREP